MKTKQTIALLFALAALHLGAWAQRDTAVVATAPALVVPAGEKADSVQRAAPVAAHPGIIGHNARSKHNVDGGGECPAGFDPGSIGKGK